MPFALGAAHPFATQPIYLVAVSPPRFHWQQYQSKTFNYQQNEFGVNSSCRIFSGLKVEVFYVDEFTAYNKAAGEKWLFETNFCGSKEKSF